jgi:membrane associated rhomboid family serine protease
MFIPYPIKAKWVIIGYAVLELTLGLGNAQTGVAHFAHLGGMIFGLLLIIYWIKTGVIRKNDNY